MFWGLGVSDLTRLNPNGGLYREYPLSRPDMALSEDMGLVCVIDFPRP